MIGIREYSDRGDHLQWQKQDKPPENEDHYYWDPNNYPATAPDSNRYGSPHPMPAAEHEDLIKCPLCYDPLIEATVSKCGHTFCHDCIYKWKKTSNWCPVCQESLTTFFGFSKLHRVYAIDDIVEEHIPEQTLDVQHRFFRRRKARLDQARKQLKSKNPIKYWNGATRELQLYIQSKGWLHGIGQIWTACTAWIPKLPFGASFLLLLLVIAFVVGRYTCDCNPIPFFTYLWKAVQDYPGPEPRPIPPPPCNSIFGFGCH